MVVSLSFEFLDVQELLQNTPSVCRKWAALSATAHSWNILDAAHKLGNVAGMLSAFPCGQVFMIMYHISIMLLYYSYHWLYYHYH
jgi:hypothetical protein